MVAAILPLRLSILMTLKLRIYRDHLRMDTQVPHSRSTENSLPTITQTLNGGEEEHVPPVIRNSSAGFSSRDPRTYEAGKDLELSQV